MDPITPPAANPESLVVKCAFLAAIFVFLISWGLQAWRQRGSTPPTPHDREPGLPSPLPGSVVSRLPVSTAPYQMLDLVWIGLVVLLYFVLSLPTATDSKPLEDKYPPGLLILGMVFQFMIMSLVISFMVRRISVTDWLGLKWKRWPWALLIGPAVVVGMGMVMAVYDASGLYSWLQQVLGAEPVQDSVRILQESQDPQLLALMALAAVVVAPLVEETVFRGYLYPAAKHFCGPVGATVFSSLVFAAAHNNAIALLPLFILAVALCRIYETTGSIWAPVSVHFVFNGATVYQQLTAR